MAASDSARPLPPLSSPPPRASITNEASRSGFAPPDVPRFDHEAAGGSEPRALPSSSFAPESAIDERARETGLPRDLVASSIYRPTGTVETFRTHLLRLASELGVTYFTIRGPHVDALAPLVRELTGRTT